MQSPRGCWSILVILACAIGDNAVNAQPATLPHPRLWLVSPAGGKIGTTVRVTVTGLDLEEAGALVFSNSAIQAVAVPDPKNPKALLANVFDVSIAQNAPVGLHDVRVVGKYGISNPRVFAVGEVQEALETEPNDDLAKAQQIALNTAIHGTITTSVDVDYFTMSGTKGQRVTVICEAESLDSRLDPEVRVFAKSNQLLAQSRRYSGRRAVADVILPEDGTCIVRVCEHAHRTGDAYHYYRLCVSTLPWIDAAYPPVLERGKIAKIDLLGRNLPSGQPDTTAIQEGKPLDKLSVALAPPGELGSMQQLRYSGETLPHQASLDGFEWRLASPQGGSNPVLLSYAAGAVVLDKEPNDTPEQAQALPGVCAVCGRIDKAGDRDWYAFNAQANEVFVLEGYADRFGSPMDLYFVVRRADNKQILGEFDDHPEATAPLHFYARTEDAKTRFVAPAAGRYEIMVSTRDAAQSFGPRFIYSLSLRKEEPDFRLVVLAHHPQSPGALTLWRGGNQYLHVTVFRRDGFAGPITLQAEHLPRGVSAPPQVIPAGVNQGVLIVSAEKDAPLGHAEYTVKGVSEMNGQRVERQARGACSVWANPNEASGIPASSRLTRQMYLAVQDTAPFQAELTGAALPTGEVVGPVGGVVPFKVKVNRLWPGVAAPITVSALSLPPNAVFNGNNQAITVAPNQTELPLTINLPANVPPGTYSLTLQALSNVPFNKDPKNANKPAVQTLSATLPVTLTVYNRLANVQVFSNSVMLKAGGSVDLLVKVERLQGYNGPFKVQLVLPQGFTGVTASEVVIPAGASETRFTLSAPPQAAPASNPGVIIRVTGTAEKVSLSSDATISVTLVK